MSRVATGRGQRARLARVLVCLAAVLALAALSVPAGADEPVQAPRPERDVFGAQVWSHQQSARVLDLVKAAGIGPLRAGNLAWDKAEPQPGQFDEAYLATWQAALADLSARGLQSSVTLFGTPAWAQAVPGSTCGPIKPDNYDEFAAFAARMVKRFSVAPYNIKRWEIWNEPDAPVAVNDMPFGCWGRPGTPDYGGRAFGDMLKVVSPAIKAADPKATVIFGGLLMGCGVDGGDCQSLDQAAPKFLGGAIAAGAGGSFDVLAYHSYRTWTREPAGARHDIDLSEPDWAASGGQLLGKLDALRRVLGPLHKPIVMNEGALLWCAPANEDPNSWCAKAGVTDPDLAYEQEQANYLVRMYARTWANGIESASWYMVNNGGWRGDGLLSRDNSTTRLGYDAFKALSTSLHGAAYAGGTVAPGHALGDPIEDYRFCTGSTEFRLLWTNADTTRVQLQTPPGTVAASDKLGHPVTVGATVTVGYEPVMLRRDLGHPCAAGRPSGTPPAVADLTMNRVGERWRQVAAVPGSGGQAGTLFSRTSTDAAGQAWPASWTRGSMADAFAGPAAGQAPPHDAIDALTQWQPPAQNGPRQEVFAGGGVWRRDAADQGAASWGSWSNSSLAAEWGGDAGHPPTDRVDAVAIRPGPEPGQWRQLVTAGDDIYQRDSADGLNWPHSWTARSLAETWGADTNHPPVDRLDALTLQSTTDAQGQPRWRQLVVSGESSWTRVSNDQSGSDWPAAWDSSTLAASWGAAATADRPPVFAQAGAWTEPAPHPAPTTPPTTVASATTTAPTTPVTTVQATSGQDATPLGHLPFTGAQIAVGVLLGLLLMAAGTAMLLGGRRGRHAQRR
jgi:hypothetical protein